MFEKLLSICFWTLLVGTSLLANSKGEEDYVARLSIPLGSALDDVEERPNGSIYSNSTDLELSYDSDNGNQKIGLRFPSVPLAGGVEVLEAYIQFTADETGADPTNLSIRMIEEDNATPFTLASHNVSQRMLSEQAINWQPPAWLTEGAQGAAQRTPDLSELINQMLSRPGWEKDNALAFVIEGNGTRTAEAFEGNMAYAPRLILEVLLPTPQEPITGLLINELMAANASISDEFGEADDWLEVYNNSEEPIEIGGLYLTDKLDQLDKWQIAKPQLIAPGEFALIWADGEEEQGGDHASFKLSADGEAVALVQKIGEELVVLDQIVFGEMPIDVSFGRITDGSDQWVFFAEATPAASNDGQARFLNADITFSLQDGMYFGTQQLMMETDEAAANIHYTLDGRDPSEDDPIYQDPIPIASSTVVSARAFKPGFAGQKTTRGTYLIDESSDVFHLNLQIDPKYLWDNEIGMYVTGENGVTGFCSEEPRNWNQDWEYPGQVTLFEPDGRMAFKVNAGVKIGGGCSRGFKMKSFNFFLRKGTYGDEKIEYQLFDQLDIHEFKRFKIRNGGNDFTQMLFRDAALHELVRGQFDMDIMAYRPVQVFLNGAYWGVYGMREFFNQDYLASHHGVDRDNLDIIKNPFAPWREVKEGNSVAYSDLRDFIQENDLSVSANYEQVLQQIDMNEFLNYFLTQIYLAAYDWPVNNMQIWRDRDNGKWRWMLFDLDATTNYGEWSRSNAYDQTLQHALVPNGPVWPNGPESTLFLRKLLDNDEFRHEFIQRMCTYIELVFTPARANEVTSRIQSQLEPLMQRHISRWWNTNWDLGGGNPSGGSINNWKTYINRFNQFFVDRPEHLYAHFAEEFDLDDQVELSFNVTAETPGTVVLHANEYGIPYQYVGMYFSGVPIQIKAVPKAGYTFWKWEETGDTNPEISYIPSTATTLTPLFVPAGPFITEVHYQPLEGETHEFIEIHNATNVGMDIGGFRFDDGIEFTFPGNTVMNPGEYVIIAKDATQFAEASCQVFEWQSGKLANEGETIRIVNANGEVMDELSYAPEAPWPTLAAGEGPSLHLRDNTLDNDLPGSWEAAVAGGTACAVTLTNLDDLQNNLHTNWRIYPNPSKGSVRFLWEGPSPRTWKISLYTSTGQQLKAMDMTDTETTFETSHLSAGLYWVRLTSGTEQSVKALIIE